MKKIETNSVNGVETKKFVDSNWPKALALAGAAGAIGAGIWLTARYLKQLKKRDEMISDALDLVEKEVEVGTDGVNVLLETGPFLGKIVGEEGAFVLNELVENTNDKDVREALSVLGDVMALQRKGV